MRSTLGSIALGVAAAGMLAVLKPRLRPYSFAGKVVLVTGGSRGLGLVLARQLADRGARVALMARNGDELDRARATFGAAADVLLVQGDVRRPEDAEGVVADVVDRYGRLDVLINNAGVIVSAPLASTRAVDFQALMDVHFWGTLYMTSAALPHLRRRRGSRVVNICSIGAKLGVPHLSAYCASKFAQAGLSSVLAQELRTQGVVVSTVYPGLMRTGSHLNARFGGDTQKEFAAFALAAGLPGVSMDAERAARQILSAVARGRAEVVVPFSVRQIARAAALMPNGTFAVLSTVNRLLPTAPARGAAAGPLVPIPGSDVGLHPAVRAAVALNERAATENNERQPGISPA